MPLLTKLEKQTDLNAQIYVYRTSVIKNKYEKYQSLRTPKAEQTMSSFFFYLLYLFIYRLINEKCSLKFS